MTQEKQFIEFMKAPFPDNLKGVEIDGVDLVKIDMNLVGLISSSIGKSQRNNSSEIKQIKELQFDLIGILNKLIGTNRVYFDKLLNLSESITDNS